MPARRVGGRWRVASDAIDAFGTTDRDAERPMQPGHRPIRSVFIANRGEIATRIARTCRRLGIGRRRPPPTGHGALDLLDIDAVVAAAVATGADARPPGLRVPGRERDFAEAVVGAGITWVGPPPARDPDDGRQGGRPAAGGVARRAGPGRLRRRRPVRRGADRRRRNGSASRCWSSRRPAAAARGCATVREPRRSPGALAPAGARRRQPFGDDRLILERLVEGGRHVEIQVLFDAAGPGRPARRARLLDPAPPPEGARGGAVAGRGRALRDAARRGGAGARPRGRLRRRRDLRVPPRRTRRPSPSSR